MNESKLPLGVCKQAIMKLESVLVDFKEIAEDEDIDEKDKEDFEQMSEYIGNIIASVTLKVTKEIGEEEFLREEINMDEFEPYPEPSVDLFDEEIE